MDFDISLFLQFFMNERMKKQTEQTQEASN
ncbi:hypothetical protein VA7868_01310 [Vibrio aerogenes CECT 7868]|uniref:Uncharacterized protein n=1 Tax=Vibrio aerogenes CECT 7868 TaxID=1216006 RepID=A0A1M5XUC8_9VIBR|nr:hypothetical protein VA7868_01310 [Vibrio aerogenes CECT 7868]